MKWTDPCLSAEIAHFKNGRSMVIENHEVVDQKVILILSGADRLEFEKDWIESFGPIEAPAIAPDQVTQQNASSAEAPSAFEELKGIIRDTAQKYRLDEILLTSIIKAESNFDPSAVSSKGAQGLMQLMPETAATYKVQNVFNARENIDAGAKYLKNLLDQFNQNLMLALAAYNAGPKAVANYKGIPPFPETHKYIRKILDAQPYRRMAN